MLDLNRTPGFRPATHLDVQPSRGPSEPAGTRAAQAPGQALARSSALYADPFNPDTKSISQRHASEAAYDPHSLRLMRLLHELDKLTCAPDGKTDRSGAKVVPPEKLEELTAQLRVLPNSTALRLLVMHRAILFPLEGPGKFTWSPPVPMFHHLVRQLLTTGDGDSAAAPQLAQEVVACLPRWLPADREIAQTASACLLQELVAVLAGRTRPNELELPMKPLLDALFDAPQGKESPQWLGFAVSACIDAFAGSGSDIRSCYPFHNRLAGRLALQTPEHLAGAVSSVLFAGGDAVKTLFPFPTTQQCASLGLGFRRYLEMSPTGLSRAEMMAQAKAFLEPLEGSPARCVAFVLGLMVSGASGVRLDAKALEDILPDESARKAFKQCLSELPGLEAWLHDARAPGSGCLALIPGLLHFPNAREVFRSALEGGLQAQLKIARDSDTRAAPYSASFGESLAQRSTWFDSAFLGYARRTGLDRLDALYDLPDDQSAEKTAGLAAMAPAVPVYRAMLQAELDWVRSRAAEAGPDAAVWLDLCETRLQGYGAMLEDVERRARGESPFASAAAQRDGEAVPLPVPGLEGGDVRAATLSSSSSRQVQVPATAVRLERKGERSEGPREHIAGLGRSLPPAGLPRRSLEDAISAAARSSVRPLDDDEDG